MKVPNLLTVALVFTTLFALAQNPGSSNDTAAIRNADKRWSEAVEQKELDKTVSLYADDATVLAVQCSQGGREGEHPPTLEPASKAPAFISTLLR